MISWHVIIRFSVAKSGDNRARKVYGKGPRKPWSCYMHHTPFTIHHCLYSNVCAWNTCNESVMCLLRELHVSTNESIATLFNKSVTVTYINGLSLQQSIQSLHSNGSLLVATC